MPKAKVIYIKPFPGTFIDKDISILRKYYKVYVPPGSWTNKIYVPINMFLQLIFVGLNINSSKAVFVMFGGYWALIPTILSRLFRKPVYIILGGADCCALPSLGYGSLRKPILKQVIKLSYKNATRLLPVHQSLARYRHSYYSEADYPQQGYRYFLPSVLTPCSVVYNGFDVHLFSKQEGIAKQMNSFISVIRCTNWTVFKLKGVDILLQLAKKYPRASFTVVGLDKSIQSGLVNAPENFYTYDFMFPEELVRKLEVSEFYVQLSIAEGFPNALCEGMLCECVPIGSDVGGIPFIISDTGFIIESDDFEHVSSRFGDIMATDKQRRQRLGHAARQRIQLNFDLNNRELMFHSLVESPDEVPTIIPS